jgi:hypothetical protein
LSLLSRKGNEQMGWPSNASAPLRMAEGGESFSYRAELGLSFTVTPTRVDRSEPRGAVSEWNSRQVELSIRGTEKDDIMRCRRLRELEKRQENQGRVEDDKASLSEPTRKKGISPGPLSSRRSAWVAFATLTSSVRKQADCTTQSVSAVRRELLRQHLLRLSRRSFRQFLEVPLGNSCTSVPLPGHHRRLCRTARSRSGGAQDPSRQTSSPILMSADRCGSERCLSHPGIRDWRGRA